MLVSVLESSSTTSTCLTFHVKGEAVPSIISLCLLPFVDESPQWLFSKGRAEEVRYNDCITIPIADQS